jgi:hypothetical protein
MGRQHAYESPLEKSSKFPPMLRTRFSTLSARAIT